MATTKWILIIANSASSTQIKNKFHEVIKNNTFHNHLKKIVLATVFTHLLSTKAISHNRYLLLQFFLNMSIFTWSAINFIVSIVLYWKQKGE